MLGQEHKLSLFTDDILIYLSHPEKSFLILISFLDISSAGYFQCSAVSGYKLNIAKTQILSFNYNPSQNVNLNIQLNWDQNHIK